MAAAFPVDLMNSRNAALPDTDTVDPIEAVRKSLPGNGQTRKKPFTEPFLPLF